MSVIVTVTVDTAAGGGRRLLAPVGIPTPYQTAVGFAVDAAAFSLTGEAHTGQMAALITPEPGRPVTLSYRYTEGGPGYPEPVFQHRPNRYTSAARDLARDAVRIAEAAADGHGAIAAIVADVACKFHYGHPDTKFNDGTDEVPMLCGLTEGSCVDINTYLIASLRAAGYAAGYITGYFFPAEKQGCCDDMHCWVVTRHDGVTLEWDIAHHLKMGTTEVCCGLNPKPGERVAAAHSMGLDFPEIGLTQMKLLAEPLWVDGAGGWERTTLDIRLRREPAPAQPALSAAS